MKPKLLIITPFFSHTPLRGYERMIQNHIKHILDQYDVDLITIGYQGRRKADLAPGLGKQTSVRLGAFERALGVVSALLQGHPFQAAEFCSRAFLRHVKQLTNDGNYDHIICYMARTFVAVPESLHHKTVVFAIDPLQISYHLQKRNAKFLRRVLLSIEGYFVSRLEKYVAARSKKMLLISQYDIGRMQRLGRFDKGFGAVRYGVTVPNFRIGRSKRNLNQIIISGSWFYRPNSTALVQILTEVWPEFQRFGDFTLKIVGAGLSPDHVRLARGFADVEVAGFVDDIFSEISAALATLCLVELDVGIQTKILESMACGTPVIAWPSANRGIRAIHNEQILIARNAAEIGEFANSIRQDANKWENISESGFKFVQKNFTWKDSAEDLLRFL